MHRRQLFEAYVGLEIDYYDESEVLDLIEPYLHSEPEFSGSVLDLLWITRERQDELVQVGPLLDVVYWIGTAQLRENKLS